MEGTNPDFRRWLKNLAQRSDLRRFWRWWLAELAPLMPERVRTALRRRLLPIVAIGRDAAALKSFVDQAQRRVESWGATAVAVTRRGGRQIGVSVQFFASTPALQKKILYAMEAGQPHLFVENMTLRPLNAFRGFRPVPGQEVNVQLDAGGLRLLSPQENE
jgi:hypothetical protein